MPESSAAKGKMVGTHGTFISGSALANESEVSSSNGVESVARTDEPTGGAS